MGRFIIGCVIAGTLGLPVPRVWAQSTEPAGSATAHGFLKPVGPPAQPPTRIDAGGSCVIDLVGMYELSGSLSGSATVDYRILVEGPCGSPPGTFAEQWIARGEFKGTIGSSSVDTRFTYVAQVAAGGKVTGSIVLGPESQGALQVSGRFADGRLSYSGWTR